ncbi:MAG: hypothetical protein RBU21_20250 [FCB group bacterium]|nr:hypothetical protein [FCB group bacterium]
MNKTIGDAVMEVEAEFCEAYKAKHGTLDGCNQHLADMRPHVLVAAKERIARLTEESERQGKDEEGRNRMPKTIAEKAAYIKQFGVEAFKDIVGRTLVSDKASSSAGSQ